MSIVLGVAEVRKRWKGNERRFKTRVYFSPAGETVMENFVGRRTRPYEEYRKLLPGVLAEVGIRHDARARWSQRAGCTCPCSPGFVLDVAAGFDVFVTVNQSEDAEVVAFDD